MASLIYRVLLLEDNKDLLQRIRGRMNVIEHQFAGDHWHVELSTVQISIEKRGEFYAFTSQTIDEIAVAVREGIDLLIADFGYVDDDALKEAYDAAETLGHGQVHATDVQDRVLTIIDLARAMHAYVGDNRFDSGRREAMRRFLSRKIPMILYSYTSHELYHVYGSVPERANHTRATLTNFDIEYIDSKHEFYGDYEFDWPNTSKHDLVYYHFLLSGWLAQVIRQRFYGHLLSRAEAAKSIRVTRTAQSVALLVAIGSSLAGTVEWISARVVNFYDKKQYAPMAIYSSLALVLVAGASLALPWVFEKMMSVLLRRPESDD